MSENDDLEKYLKKIQKICVLMHDKKHNLKKFNNKKTIAFTSFSDGIKYSKQPHYVIHSLIDEYFVKKKISNELSTKIALIFTHIIKNNG